MIPRVSKLREPDAASALTYTIVTRSHFFLATALAENFRESNPDGRFLIVVADADDPETEEPNWDWLAGPHRHWRARVVSGRPLGLEHLCSARQICPTDFWGLAFQYAPLELTCCLKGRVAESLLRLGETQLLYLDADTRIYDAVENCLLPLLPQGGVLLTPHLQSPLPEDGCYPNNVDLLRSGVFNGGVVGFVNTPDRAESVTAFLEWWNHCTLRDCVVDPHQGLFVDQRWLDQAPAYFADVKISRHLGLNVGYWNLHERRVVGNDRPWRIQRSQPCRSWEADRINEGVTLQVFHFSGAALVAPDGTRSCHRLSRHQNRHGLKSFPAVETLTANYLNSWVEHSWLEYQAIPYQYQRLSDGVEIPARWREAYRLNSCQIRETAGNPFRELRDPRAAARFDAAAQVKNLRSGRFQYHLEALHARIENLKHRLDQLPWRRIFRATQNLQKRWFKKAG